MAYSRSLADALGDCATLLDIKVKGEKIKYNSLLFIRKDNTLQYGNVLFLPRVKENSKYRMEHFVYVINNL